MMDTQIYRNFLTPQSSNEISLGGFLKFSVLVERTACITWESAGIARLKSLSETTLYHVSVIAQFLFHSSYIKRISSI